MPIIVFRFAGAARTEGSSSSDSDRHLFFGGGGPFKVLTLPATERGLNGLKGFIGHVSRKYAASRQRER